MTTYQTLNYVRVRFNGEVVSIKTDRDDTKADRYSPAKKLEKKIKKMNDEDFSQWMKENQSMISEITVE